MKICDYTKRELDHLRSACNFTPQEERLFDLKSREYTNDECAEMMHTSERTISRLNQRIKEKIKHELT